MKVQTRLSIAGSIVFGVVFALVSIMIYGLFYHDSQSGDFAVVSEEGGYKLQTELHLLLGILLLVFLTGVLLIIFLNRILLGKIAETIVIQKNFVKYVSHEFKTPLASLLGNLEVFAIKDRTPKEYEDIAQKLIREITQLQEILDTLIMVSDLREMKNTPSAVRVDELIQNVIDRITERYKKVRICIDIPVPSDAKNFLTADKDRTQLLMVFYNLIENAVKYSAGDAVHILLYEKNKRLIVSIQDNGIGIPSNQLKNIRKPFYRADNTSMIQGNGIGLSIALRILEKNRINYKIESETNRGTTVKIYL